MIKKSAGKKVDTVFVLIIFSVFALSVLMVLMLGAGVYKNMNDMTRENQDERMLLSYIWTKVKAGDKAESIRIGDFYGHTALCFDEVFDDAAYSTMIYHFDGWVYELFSEVDIGLYPEDGIPIMKIDDLTFENIDYGMIKVSSGESSLLLYPRSGS